MAALFADAQRYAATSWPAQADGDVVEIPFVATLLVVDDQPAVLQADFTEILSAEPGQAQTVEPVEASQHSVGHGALIRRCRWSAVGRGSGWRRRRWRGRSSHRPRLSGRRRRHAERALRCHTGR